MTKKQSKRVYPGRPIKTEENPRVLAEWAMFAKNMAYLRKKMQLSQRELGEKLGLHRTSVNRMENGHHQPFWGMGCLICDALKVSAAEMRIDLEAAKTKNWAGFE